VGDTTTEASFRWAPARAYHRAIGPLEARVARTGSGGNPERHHQGAVLPGRSEFNVTQRDCYLRPSPKEKSIEQGGTMSNHLSGTDVKFPGGDARLDLTDLFAFVSPDDPDKTVLIRDVDPFLTAPAFHPEAVYRINVDNDGVSEVDVAFPFTFPEPQESKQTATAYLARGAEARQPAPAGDIFAAAVPVEFDGATRPVPARQGRVSESVVTRSSPAPKEHFTGSSSQGTISSPERTC
jgi:hypothetical protein